MSSINHLLPEPDQAVRCTEHRRTLAIDPGGTAIRADRVVLVKTSLPWPKPVFDHQRLKAIAPILKGSTMPTRTLAYVPADGSSTIEPDGLGPLNASVITFDRSIEDPSNVTERRFKIESAAELESLAVALAENDLAAVQALAGYEARLVTPVALVCTQGSHDVCCGSEGARFAAEADSIDDLVVYRVSHTGGHRFAPTAMTLPDGRMWADLDLDLLRQILSKTGNPSELVQYCRGWWGASTGPAQMAERALFSTVGWDLEDRNRTVEVGEQLDGTTTCVIEAGAQSWSVEVEAGRTVPTVACRQPGGLPAKSAIEYRVSQVTRLTNPSS